MSFNWKQGVLVGIIVFLYLSAMNKFWPDLNVYLSTLILAILVGFAVTLSNSAHDKKNG